MQWRSISRNEIEDVVREMAISKLCSMLEIGPAVQTSIPFDVVVYTNAVQFHLEKCKPLSKQLLQQYRQQFDRDIKECLQALHSIGVVQRDIKRDNILWNDRLQRFVLCDFGLSTSITEKVGQKTLTEYCGTAGCMSK
jgi:serine/threonine protein kinase